MATDDPFDLKFTSREVSAWGGLALLKRMLDGLDSKAALRADMLIFPTEEFRIKRAPAL